MTDSEIPSSVKETTRPSHSWLKGAMAIGGAIVIVGGVAGWLGWRELKKRLPGMISEELSGALGRPIKLGELQRFGFTGLRFGETILPPTPDDFTWARVKATDIALNPLDLVFRRTFRPNLLLLHPEVSIKQRFDRTWVLQTPDSADDEGAIKTEIGQIRIRNAAIAVGPVARQQIVQAPEDFSSAQLIVLENVNLSVRFRGEQNELVALNLGGRLKNGTFRIKGEGNLDSRQANFTILGKKLRIDTLNPFLGGSLFLGEGYGYANLYAEIRPDQEPPLSLEGAARLQNGEALITGLPSKFEAIYSRLQFHGQRVTFDDTDLRFGPIESQVSGQVSLDTGYQVRVVVPDVNVEQVETAFAYPLPIPAEGRFSLLTDIQGPLLQPQIQGQLRNLSAISVDRVGVEEISADFSGDANQVRLDNFQVVPTTGGRVAAQGTIDFEKPLLRAGNLPPTALALTADIDLPLDPVAQLYDVKLPIQLGRLTATTDITGPLVDPIAIANWQLNDGIAVGSGRIDYAANLATLINTQLTVADTGFVTAAGEANLATQQINLDADALIPLDEVAQQTAIALPAGLTLGTLTANASATGALLNPVAEVLWQLRDGAVPGQGRLTYADQLALIRDTFFDVGDGRLEAAGQADFRNQIWSLGLAGDDLRLSEVSPQLVGSANVGVSASGSLLDLSPVGVRASGDLTFSEGVPVAIAGTHNLLDGPLALTFDWDGSILGVPTLTAPRLDVSGQVATVPDAETGFPTPSDLNFAVRLSDYDLARLNDLSPAAAYGALVQGRLDFDGTVSGSLEDPAVLGNIALRDTAVGSLALLSDVQGPLEASRSRGGRLNLVGELTTLQAEVGPDLLPISLLFENGPVLAQAQREGDWLRGNVRDFPLDALAIRPITDPNLGVISGTLRSDFEVKLSTLFTNPTVNASFGVNRPALGSYGATALQGGFQLHNWRASLSNTFLAFPNSRFDIEADADLRSPLAANISINTADAEIQDILTALQIDELEDLQTLLQPTLLGTAADLETTPIGGESENLATQIELAEAARALQTELEAAEARSLIPPLSDLQGTFSVDMTARASEANGIAMEFDINGRDWVWGKYAFANQFVAQGDLNDQVLTLAPIRIESGAAFANLEGRLALDGFDTQLEVANFDLAPVARWLELPVPLQGEVNILAELAGSPGNPALLGTFAIENAAVNNYPVAIGSDFSYRDAWFRFDAKVKGEPDEPLRVQGQVPYALPFMTLQPSSDELLVQASLGSGGFALIDIFSPYVAWGGGDASLLVEAKGPISQPEVLGTIEFQEASLTSEFLGESLTTLNGTIGFVGDRLQVSGLHGTLLDGQFFLMGELPFLTSTAATAPSVQPLTLTLNTLNFNFENEIISTIDGRVVVNDSLQSPAIGGDIAVSGVEVGVGRETLKFANSLLFDPGIEAQTADWSMRLDQFGLADFTGRFDDFRLLIPDIAKIGVYPLLRIDATGEVIISGPIWRPRGDGYVELLAGWVNTVTTDLFLVTDGRRNVITLDPAQGFDPYVDLVFRGDLPLQRRYDLPNSNEFAIGNTSEVPDLDPLASVTLFDEILIEAAVQGYISQGSELLDLSSTPTYSEEQLLSMLTGGYLADLPGGEPAIALSANAFLSLFAAQQDVIGDAIGLRRLRVGAATTLPTDAEGDVFGIGLGIQAGITDSLTAGLVQVLNRNQPYQLNLQYRVNNQFGIEGSTDFSEDSRLFLQYRFNF